jgi:Holliday junction DNA helicase RuvA
MIAYVEGRLFEMTENACVVVTPGGVGYEVFLTAHSLSRLPGKGEEVRFFACTIVREDALELFGFETWDERETFLVLTSISRVGARTAMAILSVFRPDDLRSLAAGDDMLALTRVPGIGKKTGQQIFLELKYKLRHEAIAAPAASGEFKSGGVQADAVAGLMNLGYDEDEAARTVKKVLADKPELDVSGALRAALKTLARGRS